MISPVFAVLMGALALIALAIGFTMLSWGVSYTGRRRIFYISAGTTALGIFVVYCLIILLSALGVIA